MGATTNNPFLIAMINMTIVFGVLICLGLMMVILHAIDPTKKPTKKPAPKAAPAPAAAPAVAAPVVVDNTEEIVAVISAAVAAAQGTSANNVAIMSIQPSAGWKSNAFNTAISVRNEMF